MYNSIQICKFGPEVLVNRVGGNPNGINVPIEERIIIKR